MMMNNKTQTQQPASTINLNSQYFINQIETVIIQVAKALAIEHQLPVDPDSKEMTREIVQMKINTLLDKKTVDNIQILYNKVTAILKDNSAGPDIKKLAGETYHLLKLTGLNNV